MAERSQARNEGRGAAMTGLRSILIATGGAAKVEELYRLMVAEEAAHFLGLALQTLRNMTARGELPVIKTGKRGVGYRVVDLIEWQNERERPTQR